MDSNLNTPAPAASSNSIASSPHSWNLTDLANIPKNGLKVFSTFSCGGGSSMGYKLAGFDVIAANDIDPEMQWHYEKNLKPKHYILAPIADLLTQELPPELFNLDVLDGSPPCSTFSVSGNREKDWGKLKHFREGQSEQVLSDLFFDYLNLVDRLKPKVAIAENVRGILIGNAKGYSKLIVERFRAIGYRPQVFLIDAADCGVPQHRERVFFCAIRDDIEAPKLTIKPNAKWVTVTEACEDLPGLTDIERVQSAPSPEVVRLWPLTEPGVDFASTKESLGEKPTQFNSYRLAPDTPANTVTASCRGTLSHWNECRKLTLPELIRLGSFPDDYEFRNVSIGSYMIGMSVPPRMTQYVATEIAKQWLLPQ
jgi:DNA (cytosine-5)-methyltransferase 1